MPMITQDDLKPEKFFREKIAAREADVAAYIYDIMNTDRQPDFDDLVDQAKIVKKALRQQDKDREKDKRDEKRRGTRRRAWHDIVAIDIDEKRKLAATLMSDGVDEARQVFEREHDRLKKQHASTIRNWDIKFEKEHDRLKKQHASTIRNLDIKFDKDVVHLKEHRDSTLKKVSAQYRKDDDAQFLRADEIMDLTSTWV
jgi:hypothetical protein